MTASSSPPHRALSVVVTGGSSGIGHAIVEKFCSEGHFVLFTFYHNKGGADSLVAAYPGMAYAVYCDQGDFGSIINLYKSVKKWLSGRSLDVLINNAALGSATVESYSNLSPLATRTVEHGETDEEMEKLWKRAQKDEALMRVNALGPLWVTQTLMPLISALNRSVIIMIGSVGGSSTAVFPEYCPADLMSKAALGYLSRHLAADHIRDNVDVICVSPGATNTEMFRKSTLEKLSMRVEDFIEQFPKGRLIEPEEIASTVVWLATQNASKIFHGAMIDASMGLCVRPGLQTEATR